jgi:hypothetical protein
VKIQMIMIKAMQGVRRNQQKVNLISHLLKDKKVKEKKVNQSSKKKK